MILVQFRRVIHNLYTFGNNIKTTLEVFYCIIVLATLSSIVKRR